MKESEVTQAVRERYSDVAKKGGLRRNTCCGGNQEADEASKRIGYSQADLAAPAGANLGLGCGNPLAMASLKAGETVLDLGSGGGFDCFIAAGIVGKTGKVIGVDMTPAMIDRSRENIAKSGHSNVEFRLGEIENLPVSDSSVDIIISNCVINLSQRKDRVFAEAFRVLKPGGRLMVSDMVLLSPLPKEVLNSLDAYVSCIAGASLKSDYIAAIKAAGFKDVSVAAEDQLPLEMIAGDPNIQAVIEQLKPSQEELLRLAGSVVSDKISAFKPAKSK
jgi:SAM-dependent methyltransferase